MAEPGLLEMGTGIILGGAQLILGLALSMGSIYLGLKIFDRMTPGINEIDEIKKGNAAVGILMAAVVLSVANIVEKGIGIFTKYIEPGMSIPLLAVTIFMSFFYMLFGVIIAIFALYIALWLLDKITVDINETEEFKQGNVALAAMEAGVIIAVSFVIKASVAGIMDSSLLSPKLIALYLGIS
ncbi:MAG: DUF350 domain-containing protein [Candidatus Micrarchaeota archaeon]